MKRVFVSDLQEGMVIGQDTYTSAGILIIPAGVSLTAPIIARLNEIGVIEVTIDENIRFDDTQASQINQKRFVEFNKEYTKSKDKLNNTFAKIISSDVNKQDIEELVDSSWKMIDETHNSYEMMGMIYSMHSYSDATYMHCMNVGVIATLIGKWLGWKKEDLRILNACGIFHDIGKIAIDKSILDKPGKLTDEEYEIMKTHTTIGYNLLKKAGVDDRICNAALMHHERCDGSGYPLKANAERIDEYTKIIAIADVYEALTANRVYRSAVCPFDVIAKLEDTGFGIFDTKILLVFLNNIVNSYLHSKVRLSNGESAEVVFINQNAGSRPILMTDSGETINMINENELRIDEVLN